ncbi:uncharacterized protein [Haliotis cracherodii]|uniref:uncharacterized protein n=1 Tax=Haliotis cracherodii TaxID=6455 RepID=UPI0039EC970B
MVDATEFEHSYEDCDNSYYEEDTVVFTVNSNQGNFKKSDLFIANEPVTLLVDVSAKVSILNETVYRHKFAKYQLHAPKQSLLSYNNETLEIVGISYLDVELDGQIIHKHPFYISRQGACLMGVDLFNALDFQIYRHGSLIQTMGTTTADVICQFPSVFSGFGEISSFSHSPRINPQVPPVSQRLRRIPLSVRAEVETELEGGTTRYHREN